MSAVSPWTRGFDIDEMRDELEPSVTKETALCCQAKALPDGRPVIGFCGPDCVRRPK